MEIRLELFHSLPLICRVYIYIYIKVFKYMENFDMVVPIYKQNNVQNCN